MRSQVIKNPAPFLSHSHTTTNTQRLEVRERGWVRVHWVNKAPDQHRLARLCVPATSPPYPYSEHWGFMLLEPCSCLQRYSSRGVEVFTTLYDTQGTRLLSKTTKHNTSFPLTLSDPNRPPYLYSDPAGSQLCVLVREKIVWKFNKNQWSGW